MFLIKTKKKNYTFYFFLIIISMFLEVFSIGLIVPVMMSILNQDITTLLPLTEPILNYIGSYKNKDLVIFTSLALVCSYFVKNLYLLFLKIEGDYLAKIEKN